MSLSQPSGAGGEDIKISMTRTHNTNKHKGTESDEGGELRGRGEVASGLDEHWDDVDSVGITLVLRLLMPYPNPPGPGTRDEDTRTKYKLTNTIK